MCTVVLWVCAVVSVMLPVMLKVNLVVPLTEVVAWVDVEVHKAHTEADTPPKKEFKAPSMMIGPLRVQCLLPPQDLRFGDIAKSLWVRYCKIL